MCKTLRAFSLDGLATAVLECWADGDAFFVDACITSDASAMSLSRVTPITDNTSATSVGLLFDFGLYWRGSLCVGMVIYPGSYLRDKAGGVVGLVFSRDAAVTVEELVCVGNP